MTTTHNTSVAFQLDSDIIAKDIYASSALRFFLDGTQSPRPAPLSPDNKGALRHIIHNAASFVILSMLSKVENLELNGPEDPMIHVTLKMVSGSAEPTTVRRLLESAIASYTLHLVYSTSGDVAVADTFRTQSLALLADLNAMLGGTSLSRLKPCLF